MPKTELVIVKPNFDISTKEAYTTWDKFNLAQTKLIKTYNMVKFINEIGKKSEIEMISKYMHNDFETITKNLYPEIIRLKDILSSLGAFAVQLTGSGPTFFAMFSNIDVADTAAQKLKTIFFEYNIMRTCTL